MVFCRRGGGASSVVATNASLRDHCEFTAVIDQNAPSLPRTPRYLTTTLQQNFTKIKNWLRITVIPVHAYNFWKSVRVWCLRRVVYANLHTPFGTAFTCNVGAISRGWSHRRKEGHFKFPVRMYITRLDFHCVKKKRRQKTVQAYGLHSGST